MDKKIFKECKIFKENIISLVGETKQIKIAEALDVSESKVSRWFSGNLLPTTDDLLLISEKYNCSIDWLIGNDRSSSNDLSVYDICKSLVEIDSVAEFSQEEKKVTRKYDKNIDFFETPDEYGEIETQYCCIYFPDKLEDGIFSYSYAGKEINNFLKKFDGLKKAYHQRLIDEAIFKDAVNAQLRKLDTSKITYRHSNGFSEIPQEAEYIDDINEDLPFE